MKKSLIGAMLCMTLSVGISMSAHASGQAPPGIYAATSNKVGIGGGGGGGDSGGITPLAMSEGKAFVLTAVGLGTPMVWRPAVDKIQPPPLLFAAGFGKNHIDPARLPATSLGEPPGAIFI